MPITFAAVATADKLIPLGFDHIIGGFAGAQGLPNIPDGAELAIIQPIGGAIRFRDDGPIPTVITGMVINAGDTIQYSGDLVNFAFIQDGSGPVTEVNVLYYRYGV